MCVTYPKTFAHSPVHAYTVTHHPIHTRRIQTRAESVEAFAILYKCILRARIRDEPIDRSIRKRTPRTIDARCERLLRTSSNRSGVRWQNATFTVVPALTSAIFSAKFFGNGNSKQEYIIRNPILSGGGEIERRG